MAEETRALGYICPACGKIVYGERTGFAMRAATVGLVCACGRSKLTAEPFGDVYRVSVPCGVCGGEHRAEVPAAQVLAGEGVVLACPEAGQFCCCIGSPGRASRALRDMEQTAEKRKERGDGVFVDDVVMYEVLSELRDIAARGGIRCTCGHEGCSMAVRGSAVDLICPACGGALRVPAATDEDLDRLCCQVTLTIRGRKDGA